MDDHNLDAPGNLAVALHPRDSYSVIKAGDGNFYITAEALAEKTMRQGGISDYETVLTMPGSEFEFMTAEHPSSTVNRLS